MLRTKEDLYKNIFKVKLNSYLQSTNYTCVASSYLMCLNKFFPEIFTLTAQKELEIHNQIKFWEGGDGEYGSYPKLAVHALNLGLNVNLTYHNIKKPDFIEQVTWDKYMENYLPVINTIKKNQQFKCEEKNFNTLDLLNEVLLGYLPIVEIKYPTDNCTHHIVIRGFDGSYVKIADPIVGFSTYSIDQFENLINIGYMKNFISLSKPDGLELKLISEGISASEKCGSGKCYLINGYDENFPENSILVAPRTDPEMTPNLLMSSGIITDQGGMLCHAAIVAREIGIPAIVGTSNATKTLKNEDIVYLDGSSGKIYLMKK